MDTDKIDFELRLADGKYIIRRMEGGGMKALRYNEEWRDLTGDNVISYLVSLVEELQEQAAKGVIPLSKHEAQSGLDRVRYAEGLIRQLPATHDGRNTWLANYGAGGVYDHTRARRHVVAPSRVSTGLSDSDGVEIFVGDVVRVKTSGNVKLHGEWAYYEVVQRGLTPVLDYLRSEKGQILPKGYSGCALCDYYDAKLFLCITDLRSIGPSDETIQVCGLPQDLEVGAVYQIREKGETFDCVYEREGKELDEIAYASATGEPRQPVCNFRVCVQDVARWQEVSGNSQGTGIIVSRENAIHAERL